MLNSQKVITVFIGLLFFPFFLVLSQAQAADTTVSGTISLPASVGAYSTDQYISTRIYHDWNGSWYQNSSFCQSVTLMTGETSVAFECTISDLSGVIIVEANASYLDGIYYGNFYNSNGTEWIQSDAEQLPSGTNHSEINITLLPGITVEGELQTPEGTTFTTSKNFSIYHRYWDDPWWSWGNGSGVTLSAGETSVSYNLLIPAHLGDFKVQYVTRDTLEGGFTSEGFYNTIGTQYLIDDAQVLNTQNGDLAGANMTLLQGLPVTGTISLPSGDTNSDGMQVGIAARPFDDWNVIASVEVTIPAGSTSAPYTLYVPPGKNIEVRYFDVTGADETYVTQGYYTGNGTSFRFNDSADFPPDNPPPDIALTLIPGNTISGTISLPSGVTSSDFEGSIDVSFSMPGHYWQDSMWEWFSVASGTSSSNYNAIIPADAYDISIQYYLNYGSEYLDSLGNMYMDQGYYNTSGTTGDYSQRTLLQGGYDYPDSNLTFVRGVAFRGSIALPDDLLAGEDMYPSISAYKYNSSAQGWDYVKGVYPVIETGSHSSQYVLVLPPDTGDVILQYSLYNSTGNYIKYGYYNPVATTSNADLATALSTATDQPDLDMTLIRYKSITGQVSLINSETAVEDIHIALGLLTQPDGEYHTTTKYLGSYHTTQKFFQSTVIPAGANAAAYTLNLAEDLTPQDVSIEYGLSPNDSGYVNHGFYVNNGGHNVTGFLADAGTFTVTSDISGINMTMPHGYLVQGTVTLPEPIKKRTWVEIGLRAPSTGIDNFYDTTLVFPWQATSIDYSYRVMFDDNAVLGMKTGGQNGYLPELYFKTVTETVSDLAEATVFNAGSPLPQDLDFNLLSWSGDVNLDKDVNLTDAILALQTISGFSGLSVFKEGDATGDKRIGVADAVHILQEESGLFDPVSCADNNDCGSNEFCKKDNCSDISGTCLNIPGIYDCGWFADPVCGCDGQAYASACEAAINGTNVDPTGSCETAGGE